MKFQDMPYKRPDFDAVLAAQKAALKQMAEAADQEAFFAAIEAIDRDSEELHTLYTLCHVRNAINTQDAFYEAEMNVFDEQMPRFQEISAEHARIALQSPFSKDLAQRYGEHVLEKFAVAQKVFKPEIVEDLVEENKLTTRYEKLMASAQIEFRGSTYNLSGLTPFMVNPDRETRKEASEASWGWIAAQQQELDDIYDRLVKVRTRIAKKLGFENFIPVAYARWGRTDWNQQDAKFYRDQIAALVVPFAQKLYQKQAERLGIEDMKFYDYGLEFLSGNATPKGDEAVLVKEASEMYNALSKETGEFFKLMTDWELMDLTTKPGKRGGGFMTEFPGYRVPFIFSNFNGTSGDVDVLTHEAGHAFQGYLQRDVRPSFLRDATMEVMEIHSMSMEFFTHPWMKNFFGPEDVKKYYYSHIADAVKFLPYGASIDELQEWVYANPDATPEQRRRQYREIEKKYLPHLDYDGIDFLEKGGRWQKQHHVYSLPFYYLDYTISQVCAFQYFVWDKKDHEAAWQSYLNVCRRAGVIPFKKLAKESGLKSPFEAGCIDSVLPTLTEYFDNLDMTGIR